MEQVSLVFGALLSFVFEYVPGLSAWFARQADKTKRLVMIGLLVATAVGIYVAGCQGWVASLECPGNSLLDWLWMLGLAAVGNQTAHRLGKRPSNFPQIAEGVPPRWDE